MADKNLYHNIEISTAHRPSRDYNANLIFKNPELLTDLIAVAFNTKDKYHYKACWILELVAEEKLDWLKPHLDNFCKTLPSFSHDGAVRSISKICWFAALRHNKFKDFLTQEQVRQITETCFDWLIGNTKVASKAYAMRALFETGKLLPWIYADLKDILEKDYSEHSPAYQAASRELLKKMK